MSSPMVGPTGKAGNKIPSGYKLGQIQNYPPEFMEMLKQLMGHLGPDSFLDRLASGDQSMFAEMEQPALRQFGELQGGLASKFSGMGMGSRNSSGFQNTMNQATSDFAQGLQSKRMEYQNQAIKDLVGMGSTLLQNNNPYETNLIKKQPSFWESLMSSLGENAGALPAAYAKSQWGV